MEAAKGEGVCGVENRRQTARAAADERQHEAFKAWVNWVLKDRGLTVKDLAEDFADGTFLIQLAEILTAEPLLRWNKNPTLKVQMLENVQIALIHLQARGLSRTTIKSKAIVEKDNRAVLSLFWQMIVRFQLGSGVRAVFRGKGDEKDLNNLLASLRKNESERFHNLPAADLYDLEEETKIEVGSVVELKAEEAMTKVPCKRCGRPMGPGKAVLVDKVASYHLDCFVCCTCRKPFTKHYWELNTKSFDRPSPVQALPLPSPQLVPLPPPLSTPSEFSVPPIPLASIPPTAKPPPPISGGRKAPIIPPPIKNLPPSFSSSPSLFSPKLPPSPTRDRTRSVGSLPQPLNLDSLPPISPNAPPPPPSPRMERPLGPYCFEHYLEAANLRCGSCHDLIRDKLIRAMRRRWHQGCFTCCKCKTVLSGSSFYEHEGKPYCMEDFYHLKGWVCARCDDFVQDGDKSAMGKAWHRECFVCYTCNRPFGKDGFYNVRDFPYCPDHYQAAKAKAQSGH